MDLQQNFAFYASFMIVPIFHACVKFYEAIYARQKLFVWVKWIYRAIAKFSPLPGLPSLHSSHLLILVFFFSVAFVPYYPNVFNDMAV